MIITIDGPVASGKSTAGRMLAKRLGMYYLYSGLLYRALGYILCTRHGYTEETLANIQKADVEYFFHPERFVYLYDDQFHERILFENEDITPHLKTAQIDKYASILATLEPIRNTTRAFQRELARRFDVIVDGRDAGSSVFPNADIKIFLTASLSARAVRWKADQENQGRMYNLDEAMRKVSERDMRDEQRKHDPLVIPDDAIVINNSMMTPEEAGEEIFQKVQKEAKTKGVSL